MKQASVIEVLKYALNTFFNFKNFLFFIKMFVASFFIWVGGAIASALIAAPFLLLGLKIREKLFQEFSGIYNQLASLEKIKKATVVLAKVKEILGEAWIKICDLFSQSPYVVILIALGLLIFLIGITLVFSMLCFGWRKISLDFYDKNTSSIRFLLVKPKYIFKAFLFVIVTFGLAIFASILFTSVIDSSVERIEILYFVLALFVIYLLLKFAYSLCFIVDKKMGLLQAMKRSFLVPRGARKLFLFNIILAPVGNLIAIGYLLALLLLVFVSVLFSFLPYIGSVIALIFGIFSFSILLASLLTPLLIYSLGTAFLYRRLTVKEETKQ